MKKTTAVAPMWLAPLALLFVSGAVEGQTSLVDVAGGCAEAECPDAPTGTVVAGPRHGYVRMTWTPAETGGAVSRWEVLYAETGEVVGGTFVPASRCEQVYANLDVTKTYDVQVRGIGSNGEIGDSAGVTGVAPLNDPSKPPPEPGYVTRMSCPGFDPEPGLPDPAPDPEPPAPDPMPPAPDPVPPAPDPVPPAPDPVPPAPDPEPPAPDPGPPAPEPDPEPDPDADPEPVPDPEPPTATFTVDVPCADGLCRVRTGEEVTFTDTSSGDVSRRSWDFYVPAARAPSGSVFRHAWSSPGFYEVTLTVSGAGVESAASRVFLVEAASPLGTCEPDGETLCLQDSRYQVRATWQSPEGELLPAGGAHAGTNDSGLLWFHDAENWEVLVKVLDGCALNGADWVFAASATDLGLDIAVTDTVTGEVRRYENEPGRPADAFTDTGAFTDRCGNQGTQGPASTASGAGAATSSALLLNDARFEVSVEWSTSDGRRGEARPARPGTADSGLFWFFEPDNWEMLIKVLDGCGFNGYYWVYLASATDVGLDIMVTDTATGKVRHYTKEPGAPAAAMTDAGAFPDSCQPE